MQDRDEATQTLSEQILDDLRKARARRDEATEIYLAECVEWEDAVRAAYRRALRRSSKAFAPTVTEMARELGISEKSLQLVRHRVDGTAAIPRPNPDLSRPS
jgi:hypothetical protein